MNDNSGWKENKKKFNPIESVRRDFDEKFIYYDKTGRAIIDDPDLLAIFDFFQKNVKPGSLLNLGAGPTHVHYMVPMEDKLSSITALDLSYKTLTAVSGFLSGIKDNFSNLDRYQSISRRDTDMLEIITKVCQQRYSFKKSVHEILLSLFEKSQFQEKPDLIVSDMHKLDVLKNRQFDNILLGFSLYVNVIDELTPFFRRLRKYMTEQGRILMVDFDEFEKEKHKSGPFEEDDIVINKYPLSIDYSTETLVNAVQAAGFEKDKVKVWTKDLLTDSIEKEQGLKYFFLVAGK